jgi:PHD/YefM family antitoxin component YafN of YafNO toxin-antitoxin module
MGKVEVSNDELRTVRDAMRELNRMVDSLESGDTEKFVLCQNNRMRAVVISLDTFAYLRATVSETSTAQVA